MKILKSNKDYRVEDNIVMLDKLPNNVFLLCQEQGSNRFYLKEQVSFVLPEKIYGNEEETAEKYLKTFSKQDKNMGILLTGIKGSGKSLMAKIICSKSNMPVILITECFKGVEFKNFLQSLQQEVIIFIDEFEKVYFDNDNVDNQEEFLPILDGVFKSKKLFIFTTNTMKINKFLRNRPNRIRYLKQYEGLENEVIEEIIDDLLINKEHKENLIYVTKLLATVSTDVLLNIIDEMNLYDVDAVTAVRELNVQIEHKDFDVKLFINGRLVSAKVDYNPITSRRIYIPYEYKDERLGYTRYGYYEKNVEEMTLICLEDRFEFTDKDGNTAVFIPTKPFSFKIE